MYILTVWHRAPHAAFKCKNYYQSREEIRQTFFCQIGFIADSLNFNPSKLLSFMVYRHLNYYNAYNAL